MSDSSTGRHPPHVARANQLRGARRILIQFFARDSVRDGFKAPVWMVGRAESFAGAVHHRPDFVQHQEGVDLIEANRWDCSSDQEPFAFSLLMRRENALDSANTQRESSVL